MNTRKPKYIVIRKDGGTKQIYCLKELISFIESEHEQTLTIYCLKKIYKI